MGKYIYNSAKVIVGYLKRLCQNGYKINVTQSFPSIFKEQTTLSSNDEYASYDAESLFTNIPVDETISFIIRDGTLSL